MVAGYQVLLHHEHHCDVLDLLADHELVIDDINTGLIVLDVRTGVKSVLLSRIIMVGTCTVYSVLCTVYRVQFTLYCVLCIM